MAQALGKLLLDFLARCIRKRPLRLVVVAQNLLRDGMGPTAKKPALGRGRPAFHAQDPARTHTFLAKILEESVTCRIIANDRKWHHLCAKSRKIIRGVGAPAGNHLRLAMLQDQDWCFARNARNVAVTKFVGDKIPKDNNRFS